MKTSNVSTLSEGRIMYPYIEHQAVYMLRTFHHIIRPFTYRDTILIIIYRTHQVSSNDSTLVIVFSGELDVVFLCL